MLLKKSLLAAFMLLCLAWAAANYNVVVADNGNAFVSVSLIGNGTVSLQVPPDARPIVDNALFIKTQDGISISLPQDKAATVYFTTSAYTSKSGDFWLLNLPVTDGSGIVQVSLPKDAAVSSLVPKAGLQSQSNNSLDLTWTYSSPIGAVLVNYSLPLPQPQVPSNGTAAVPDSPEPNLSSGAGNASPGPAASAQNDSTAPAQQGQMLALGGIAGAAVTFLIFAAALAAAYVFLFRKGSRPDSERAPEATGDAESVQDAQEAAPSASQPSPASFLGDAISSMIPGAISAPAGTSEKIPTTSGMKSVLAMLGDNDNRIVSVLQENGGELKRALVERRAEISKSSLALCLRRLQNKKVVELDSSGFTQKVRLTGWFRSL